MGKNKKKSSNNTNRVIQQNNNNNNNNNNIKKNNNNNSNIQTGKLIQFGIQLPQNTLLVNSDDVNKQYNENIELKAKIYELDKYKIDLLNLITQREKTIDELKKENEMLKNILDELKKQNEELKEKNEDMSKKINQLINKNELFEALSKLNDCDKLANDTFKNEYRKYFKLSKYNNNVPNIGQFIDDPPNQNTEKDEYDFWNLFCKNYPNSNNKEFREIYKKISYERIQHGAHYDINKINETEFNKLMEIALPDIYKNNKKLCDDYRIWLYQF